MNIKNYSRTGRPIGDLFEVDGLTLLVKIKEYSYDDTCKGCIYENESIACIQNAGIDSICGPCCAEYREDITNVIFEQQ